jgi:hypothetical protein
MYDRRFKHSSAAGHLATSMSSIASGTEASSSTTTTPMTKVAQETKHAHEAALTKALVPGFIATPTEACLFDNKVRVVTSGIEAALCLRPRFSK